MQELEQLDKDKWKIWREDEQRPKVSNITILFRYHLPVLSHPRYTPLTEILQKNKSIHESSGDAIMVEFDRAR